jgi:hypothetical protein
VINKACRQARQPAIPRFPAVAADRPATVCSVRSDDQPQGQLFVPFVGVVDGAGSTTAGPPVAGTESSACAKPAPATANATPAAAATTRRAMLRAMKNRMECLPSHEIFGVAMSAAAMKFMLWETPIGALLKPLSPDIDNGGGSSIAVRIPGNNVVLNAVTNRRPHCGSDSR